MGEKGWGAPTWPKAIRRRRPDAGRGPRAAAGDGRASAPPTRSSAWARACSARPCWNTAPRSRSSGTSRRSSRGELRWCQGYSEPGAGSDLAALQTKCEDAGDHWLINGQKIWTSGAQYADWCFCLVRTDTTKKHEGISLRADQHAPARRRDPADQADRRHLAVLRDLLHRRAAPRRTTWSGPLNGGWTIGKRLLQHERSGQGGGRMMGGGAEPRRAGQEVRRRWTTRAGIADADLRTRLADAHDGRQGPRA